MSTFLLFLVYLFGFIGGFCVCALLGGDLYGWIECLGGCNGRFSQVRAQFWKRWLRRISRGIVCLGALLSTLPAFAQLGQSVRPWNPLDIKSKAGLVAYWDVGRTNGTTLNGAGISQLADLSWQAGRNENLLRYSDDISQTAVWSVVGTATVTSTNQLNLPALSDRINGASSLTAGTHTLTYGFTLSVDVGDLGKKVSVALRDGGGGAIIETQLVAVSANPTVAYFTAPSTTFVSAPTLVLRHTGEAIPATKVYVSSAVIRRATSSTNYVATTTVVEDASRDLNQSTALNQPLISRADNAGNLLVQSETFATTWARARINAFGATDTGSAGAGSFANTTRTTDPLGGNTADFIQEDATVANTHQLNSSVIVLPPGEYVCHLTVKPAGRNWLRLRIASDSNNELRSDFDTTAGTIGTLNANGVWSSGSRSITSVGNGWFTCTIRGILSTKTALFAFLVIGESDNDITFDGDNTSGLYIWGASLRPAAWDSTYIATVATPAIAGLQGRRTAYFDGTAHFLKSAAFTWNQPETIVLVGKQWTWTAADTLLDGNASNSGRVLQDNSGGSSPRILLYAGNNGPTSDGFTLGDWKSGTVLFSGAASAISTNSGAATVGNAGTGNLGGFTLGANGANTAFANFQALRILPSNKDLTDTPELSYLTWPGKKEVGAQ